MSGTRAEFDESSANLLDAMAKATPEDWERVRDAMAATMVSAEAAAAGLLAFARADPVTRAHP